MSIITFTNVNKYYRKHFWKNSIPAVSDLSFSINDTGITGFIGPNGAGKTTSIKMILGITKADSGSVTIRGLNPFNPAARHRVSYISEQPYFYTYLTVVETLTFLYKLKKCDPLKQKDEIPRVVDLVQLTGHETKKVRELSKGMQQRLNMAQALMGDPEVFIFDEPMSGLDPLGRKLFRDIFRKLAQQNKCIFFSTHILEDIEALCDHVVVLSSGKLVFAGELNEVEQRGKLGTEITVENLSIPHQIECMNRGWGVSALDSGPTLIFIPVPMNARECQEYLYGNGIFPLSITVRRRSIESYLYENEQEKIS